jgi:hypothetical protein
MCRHILCLPASIPLRRRRRQHLGASRHVRVARLCLARRRFIHSRSGHHHAGVLRILWRRSTIPGLSITIRIATTIPAVIRSIVRWIVHNLWRPIQVAEIRRVAAAISHLVVIQVIRIRSLKPVRRYLRRNKPRVTSVITTITSLIVPMTIVVMPIRRMPLVNRRSVGVFTTVLPRLRQSLRGLEQDGSKANTQYQYHATNRKADQ